MITFEPHDLKRIRKQLGLTQSQLAKRAGLSQSLIAKIEAGRIDPTFSNVKKLHETIELLSQKEEMLAKDIMQKKLIYATPKEDVKKSIEKMRKAGISQLPVLDHHKILGFLSEGILLDAMLSGKVKKVEDVMHEAPPTVGKTTPISMIMHLLKLCPLILVVEKGELIGIITKTDILKAV